MRLVAPLHTPDDGASDTELVLRARGGDGWALEMLYRRHVQLVAATALRLLRNRGDAEDVAQETFLIAFEKLDQLVEPGAFRGWLVRIAVSRVHRRFRVRKLRSMLFVRRSEDDGDGVSLDSEAAEGASPEERAELALIDRALQTLPFDLRTPWVLRHVLGCSIEETADACGCSLATIKRRIGAASTVIQRHLDGGAR